jgi:hypothetical protein
MPVISMFEVAAGRYCRLAERRSSTRSIASGNLRAPDSRQEAQQMRRFAVLAVLTLALAVPATALAKTQSFAFTLAKGNTGRTFKLTLAHTGRIQIVLRYSRLHNPKAHLIMSLRQPGTDGNVILDTGTSGQGCKAAGDSYVCSIYIAGVAAGKWVVALGKESPAAVPIHLRLSWPAA